MLFGFKILKSLSFNFKLVLLNATVVSVSYGLIIPDVLDSVASTKHSPKLTLLLPVPQEDPVLVSVKNLFQVESASALQ